MRRLELFWLTLVLASCQFSNTDWEFFESGIREDSGGRVDESRLREARNQVEKYKSSIDRLILETQWHGDALRFLGDEYFRRQMYGPAQQAYSRALEILPGSFSLWYRLALSHAQLATLALDPDERKGRSLLAVRAYNRALGIEANHTASLYGLSILHVFELSEPDKALPLLDRLLNIEPRNTRALFVRARARFETGDLEGAVRDYDAIINFSSDPGEQESARRNRNTILGGVR